MVALLKGSHDSQTTAAEVAERNGEEFLLVNAAETRALQRATDTLRWFVISHVSGGNQALANEVLFSTEYTQ